MNIWVLGSDGRLGKELLKRVPEALRTSHKQLPIEDREACLAYALQMKPTHIINTAACVDVDRCEIEPDLAFEVNATGAGNIAHAAAAANAKLVHLSTDYVFSGSQTQPYNEDDQTEPVNVYGKSKLEGERLVLKALPTACIIRASWFFGESTLLQMKGEVKAPTDVRSRPTYYGDLADTVLKMLDQKGIYHFANSGPATRFEMAVEMLKYIDGDCTIVPGNPRTRVAPRPSCTILSTEKIEKLGIKPRPWKEALKELVS